MAATPLGVEDRGHAGVDIEREPRRAAEMGPPLEAAVGASPLATQSYNELQNSKLNSVAAPLDSLCFESQLAIGHDQRRHTFALVDSEGQLAFKA